MFCFVLKKQSYTLLNLIVAAVPVSNWYYGVLAVLLLILLWFLDCSLPSAAGFHSIHARDADISFVLKYHVLWLP